MTKHVFRHRFTAQHEADYSYDPSKPESYAAVLEKVAALRKALTDLGCTLLIDMGRPVAIRDKASDAKQAAE